jgi:hypothetical protein
MSQRVKYYHVVIQYANKIYRGYMLFKDSESSQCAYLSIIITHRSLTTEFSKLVITKCPLFYFIFCLSYSLGIRGSAYIIYIYGLKFSLYYLILKYTHYLKKTTNVYLPKNNLFQLQSFWLIF